MNLELPSNTDPILVALGSDARTLRLVHTGFRMAREQGRPWIAVHVEVLGWETPEEADQARVWLQEARELGAQIVWTKASNVVNGLLGEIQKGSASTLLMGQGQGRGPWARLEFAKTQELLRRVPLLRIQTIPLDAPIHGTKRLRSWADALGVLAVTAVLLVVCGLFASVLATAAGFPAIPAVFAIGVAFILRRWGRRASVPATLLSTLIYLYFFAEPRFHLSFTDWPKLLYFVGTLGLIQVLVVLVDRLRLETKAGRRREAETVLLMLLGRALARCTNLQEVADVLSQRIRSLYQAEGWLLIPGDLATWTRLPESGEAPPCPAPGDLLTDLSSNSVRLDPLEPLFTGDCNYLALASTRGTEGVLQIHLPEGTRFPQKSWGSLQAFAVQGALAIERVRSLETARQAHVENETERMRSSLLSAISHDLRTPLAAIQGAASSLLLPSEPLPESTRRDLLTMIHDESEHLAQLLANLLDLTRLESGAILVRKEWQPLDEVVGAALRRMESSGKAMDVRVSLAKELPLVPLDASLAEQLLINLLANAHRHAPGTPVDLRAWCGETSMELEVADQGPGIPEAYRDRIFDKFFRMPGSSRDGGAGLGLAICDAIAKAHGGRVWAEDRPGGGASFRVSLPREGAPPPFPEAELPPEEN